jgi:hypothetical protein
MGAVELAVRALEALAPLAGIFLAAYLGYLFSVRSQQRLDRQKAREDVYSELRGASVTLPQLYMSLMDADLFSDYHAEKARRTKDASEREAERRKNEAWNERRYNLVLEHARLVAGLTATLGRAERLFTLDPEGKALLEAAFNLPEPSMPAADLKGVKDLSAWWETQQEKRRAFIEASYEQPLKRLAEHLRSRGKAA